MERKNVRFEIRPDEQALALKIADEWCQGRVRLERVIKYLGAVLCERSAVGAVKGDSVMRNIGWMLIEAADWIENRLKSKHLILGAQQSLVSQIKKKTL